MKNNGRNDSTPPNLSQFRALIRQSAISRGMAIPETDEEFALLEKHFDPSKLPIHDFQAVVKMIETGETPASKIVAFPQKAADTEVLEDFAQAARNGKEILPEVQEKMAADRAAAERDSQKE
jgi:hypothetical protein